MICFLMYSSLLFSIMKYYFWEINAGSLILSDYWYIIIHITYNNNKTQFLSMVIYSLMIACENPNTKQVCIVQRDYKLDSISWAMRS